MGSYDEVFVCGQDLKPLGSFGLCLLHGIIVYQIGCEKCLFYGKIDEEVYVSQPPGFIDPKYPQKVYKVVKALYGLHQAPRAWSRFQMSSWRAHFFLGLQVKQKEDGIFISQDKYVAEILKKFDFVSVKTASTPIETQKPLVKDEEASDVDVHLYRSMIGSLMYLTASRPDIMFAAVLESCPKHNMVAYLEKTEGNAEFHEVVDFLERSFIHLALTVSPIVSTTFVEQFWMSAKSKIINNVRYITAKVAGKPVSISEASIRSNLLFDDADGIDSLPNQAIFDVIQLMGYEGGLTVLTFNKALFSPQWRYAIAAKDARVAALWSIFIYSVWMGTTSALQPPTHDPHRRRCIPHIISEGSKEEQLALSIPDDNVALTLKTKGGLELLSFDDLYYKLNTLEIDIKGYSTQSSSQSPSHSCIYYFGNVLQDVLRSLVAESEPEQQVAYKDFEQIDKLDLEEMDIKWQMAMLSVRVNKFEKKAGRKIGLIEKEVLGGSKAIITVDTLENWKEHEYGNDEGFAPIEYGMVVGSGAAYEEGAAEVYSLITGNGNVTAVEILLSHGHAFDGLYTNDFDLSDSCKIFMSRSQMSQPSVLHLPVETIWDNATRITQSIQFVPQAVLLRSGKVSFPAARPNQVLLVGPKTSLLVAPKTKFLPGVTAPVSTGKQNRPPPVHAGRRNSSSVTSGWWQSTARPMAHLPTPTSSYFQTSTPFGPHVYYNQMHYDGDGWATAVKPSAGCSWKSHRNKVYRVNLHTDAGDEGIVDSGCSRSMTGNKERLDDFQSFKGGKVTFGGGEGRITGKGTIRTPKLDFENVYYVKELQQFNLFSVSQICDKTNRVLFTDTDCLVLSNDFKLPDESMVLLRVPRKHNLYTFNLNNLAPKENLACLMAKASSDEAVKWHRRMGHVNYKNMNKLVKDNLVRGLPPKLFKNDHTCVACCKGKQHKATYKAITAVSSISEPLKLLHMDLFGPTSIRSIDHKYYCLVITDDYSRFCWVFFLETKDETYPILKDFISLVENQLNKKVKAIRCDNGTEFKNANLIELYGEKGIKRDYSNARTPQQNGVAERKIESS
ncbi:putative ribonuclease H-like domain-containing protein [Tanacetum coccineum]